MKELGYKIFAILYRIFCIFPIQDKQVFLIMTHDAGPEGNVRVVADHMKQLGKGYQFACLRREDTYFGRSLKKMWHFFIVETHLKDIKEILMPISWQEANGSFWIICFFLWHTLRCETAFRSCRCGTAQE